MENWEKDMITGVNRNAEIKALERRLRRICAKRKKANHVKVPRLRRKSGCR